MLEHRVVLGDLHRVVGRYQGRRGGQDDPLGAGGDVAQQGGRGRGHERRVVVLSGREDVQADLLRLERDRDHRLDALVLGGRAAGGGVGGDIPHGEDTELHHSDSLVVWYKFQPTDPATSRVPCLFPHAPPDAAARRQSSETSSSVSPAEATTSRPRAAGAHAPVTRRRRQALGAWRLRWVTGAWG